MHRHLLCVLAELDTGILSWPTVSIIKSNDEGAGISSQHSQRPTGAFQRSNNLWTYQKMLNINPTIASFLRAQEGIGPWQ